MTLEIRRNPDGTIDEIVSARCSVHIEQMDGARWFIGTRNARRYAIPFLARCQELSVGRSGATRRNDSTGQMIMGQGGLKPG